MYCGAGISQKDLFETKSWLKGKAETSVGIQTTKAAVMVKYKLDYIGGAHFQELDNHTI